MTQPDLVAADSVAEGLITWIEFRYPYTAECGGVEFDRVRYLTNAGYAGGFALLSHELPGLLELYLQARTAVGKPLPERKNDDEGEPHGS
jgi:hypothetical protein